MNNTKVAIQGIEASFHEMAAQKYFGEKISVVPCLTFQSLCEKLKNNEVDYAVMAIENTIAGSLLQNYSLIIDYGFNVVGEEYLNIQMHLMSLPAAKIEDITLVKSHPIALRQSAEFLWKMPHIKWQEVDDTALAAKEIAKNNELHTAALANKLAAEKYGLKILAERVETHKQNFTRFLILSKITIEIENKDKASIRVQLSHQRGALAKILNVFCEKNINLTKIQSVPIIGKPYEYSFHIDAEWEKEKDFEQSITEIKAFITEYKLLGKYKKGSFKLL